MNQESVSVRVRFGDSETTKSSSASRAVFDENALLDLASDLVKHSARKYVGSAAGGKWHNNFNRLPSGPVLSRCGPRSYEYRYKQDAELPEYLCHHIPINNWP